jgi:hypothetical protein
MGGHRVGVGPYPVRRRPTSPFGRRPKPDSPDHIKYEISKTVPSWKESRVSALKRYFIFIGILAIVAVSVSIGASWPIGYVALALFIVWPLIGTLITIDDDLPGGWSNPDGKTTPEWRTLAWNLEILLCRGAIVVAAFAFQFRDDLILAGVLVITSVAMGVVGFRYVANVIRLREGSSNAPTVNH